MNAMTLLNAWKETLSNNNRDALGAHLDSNFEFEMLGQNGMKQAAQDHLDWCVSPESPQIDDFDVQFDEGGICAGVHTARMVDGSIFDVMFFGRYGDKLESWKVLLALRS